MPEITIQIGGRDFAVSCQEGEEHFLRAAAAMLDVEASALVGQIGRIPEQRMLLMAGLMLADKTGAAEDSLRQARDEIAKRDKQIADLKATLQHALENPPKLEVPVVPANVTETLQELAARAEALADQVEEAV